MIKSVVPVMQALIWFNTFRLVNFGGLPDAHLVRVGLINLGDVQNLILENGLPE